MRDDDRGYAGGVLAGVAQLAEQLTCNEQVVGSIPSASSKSPKSPAGGRPAFTLAHVLIEREKRVLDFEGSHWLYAGPKDRAIREHLGMSATRYYQILRRVIDLQEAAEYAPLTVKRLRRVRDHNRKIRLEERLNGPGAT